MKNVIFTLAFILIGTFAFANTGVTPEMDVKIVDNLINADYLDVSKEEMYDCTSHSKTLTMKTEDGKTVTTTTRTVHCDTPEELARYHKAMRVIGTHVPQQ